MGSVGVCGDLVLSLLLSAVFVGGRCVLVGCYVSERVGKHTADSLAAIDRSSVPVAALRPSSRVLSPSIFSNVPSRFV